MSERPLKVVTGSGICTEKLVGSASRADLFKSMLLQCTDVLKLVAEDPGNGKQRLFVSTSLLETQ